MLNLHRALVLLPLMALAAAGQALPSSWESVKMIAPGTEVRIVAVHSKPVRGKLESVTDTNLVIGKSSAAQSFPKGDIQGVSAKQKGHRLRKVLIGMGVGAAAGGGIGAATSCQGFACLPVHSVMGAVIGLAGGVVAGLVWSRGEWRQVYAQ